MGEGYGCGEILCGGAWGVLRGGCREGDVALGDSGVVRAVVQMCATFDQHPPKDTVHVATYQPFAPTIGVGGHREECLQRGL